ncbi:hypothetical protein QZH41_017954, partial [Actinostola sp. cb2023]
MYTGCTTIDLDLKVYGTKFLPDDINKGKIDSIKGPGVLQIQKLRNISAPKANEESSHAPRLLKFQLTDGPVSCQGLEYTTISDISLSTPPGTKICLLGSVPVRNGMLLLDGDNTKVLGGEVESLISKWKLNKVMSNSLAKHSRNTASTEGGPPPFVPFNQSQENRGKGSSDYSKGRGRSNSAEQDESEEYRARQPSDKGTLWDFVKLTIKTPTSTPPLSVKETKESQPTENTSKENQTIATDRTTKENQTIAIDHTTESEPATKPRQQHVERTDKRTKPDTRPMNQPGKEQKTQIRNSERKSKDPEKTSKNLESSSGPSRDNKQRQYQPRQQQTSGRGRGPRGRHEDGRSYNQSLPPRLQKKQQQQQQYHQQHFMDKEDKSSSPGSGSSGEGRLSQSPSVESGQSAYSSKSSEDNGHRQQQRRQKNYPRHPRQQSEANIDQSQYDAQPAQSTYLATQPAVQHPHYHVEQHHLYEQHEGATMIQQDYNYQQPPPPPPPIQQYPVYPVQTQIGPPQAVMVTQPITSPSQQHIQTPITTAQIRWKKGNQCLALRRDGQ